MLARLLLTKMKRSHADLKEEHDELYKDGKQSAPENNAWKWDYYFGNYPESTRVKIQMDSVALYSVTMDSAADEITQIISSYLPPFASVCDATACIGGNTFSFAKYFTNVTSVEMNKERCIMLQNNVNLLDLSSRVQCLNKDFLSYMKEMPYFDFIFFDPP